MKAEEINQGSYDVRSRHFNDIETTVFDILQEIVKIPERVEDDQEFTQNFSRSRCLVKRSIGADYKASNHVNSFFFVMVTNSDPNRD